MKIKEIKFTDFEANNYSAHPDTRQQWEVTFYGKPTEEEVLAFCKEHFMCPPRSYEQWKEDYRKHIGDLNKSICIAGDGYYILRQQENTTHEYVSIWTWYVKKEAIF